MIINRVHYQDGKTHHISADIDFSCDEFDTFLIRRIKTCHVEIDLTDYEEIFRVVINLRADVVVPCAYTLEDVDFVVKTNDEIDFTDSSDDEDDDSLVYINGVQIDLKPHIFSMIVTSIPAKVVKKGAKLPEGVITFDQYQKEKEEETDSRWSALDDLDL